MKWLMKPLNQICMIGTYLYKSHFYLINYNLLLASVAFRIFRFIFIRMMPPKISLQVGGCSNVYKGRHNPDNPGVNHTSTSHSGGNKNLDVKELEMVLESYFVQIDGTLNNLTTVCSPI